MFALPAEDYSGVVTVLAVMLYIFMGARAGTMRGRHGIKAPAMIGHPEYERAARIHLNTLEQLMIFLPLLWLATHFFGGPPWLPAAFGLAFLTGRVLFLRAYTADPEKRLPGLALGMLANLGLLILTLIGLWQHWRADWPAS
jgi:glutathione S-transferase